MCVTRFSGLFQDVSARFGEIDFPGGIDFNLESHAEAMGNTVCT